MTVGRSRAILGALWIVGTAPVLLVLTIQTILGVYGDDWQLPWSWISPLIFPNLSLIIAVWSLGKQSILEKPIQSTHVLWVTSILSIFYILSIYAVVFIGHYSELPIGSIMAASSWYLLPLQAIVTGALGKFFVESVE